MRPGIKTELATATTKESISSKIYHADKYFVVLLTTWQTRYSSQTVLRLSA